MNYYAAPMEGLTDRVWRQAHQKWFGPAGNADRYYAPFISPPENRVLIKKKMAELAPEANPGAPVIPQLLAKDGELAAWMIGQLRALGYTEVNLNLGCPAGTVTAKGKGSGMLRDLAKVDAFLDGVFSHAEGPVSVKTRLGVEKPEEFAAILEIYSRYPIKQSQIIEFPNTNNGAIWTDIDVKGMTIRVINVHMQTTNLDRMRSKAAQAREVGDEEKENQIYTQFTDNMEANIIQRAKQAKDIASLVNATETPVILCGDFNDLSLIHI
mgnify:CR=1 FL=1